MNITLHTSPLKTGVLQYSPPNQPPYNASTRSPPASSGGLCGATLLRLCMDEHQTGDSQRNEIMEGDRYEQKQPRLKIIQLQSRKSREKSRKKISLSLCNSESHLRTPKKKDNKGSRAVNSQNKRMKTHAGVVVQKYCSSPIESNKDNLMVSESWRQYGKVNVHQMKQSLKPSTNIPSPNSTRKQGILNTKKTKLSLSSAFKSQIAGDLLQVPESSRKDGTTSREVIDQSFMTAKLRNIYEMNSSSDPNYPSSNIVSYNRIMVNEQLWQQQGGYRGEYERNSREHIKILDSQILGSAHQFQSQDHLWRQGHNQDQYNEKLNSIAAAKLNDRKWIGQYAATIKTFNNSESKQDIQSIVLERGIRKSAYQHYISPNLARGSMRDSSKQPFSEPIRRNCNSFGGDDLEQQHIFKKEHQEWCGSAIQQDNCSQPQN